MSVKQLRSTYQVKITLQDSKPPIWRRLLIHSNINLSGFHTVIQYSMGWLNCHLHQFEKDKVLYGIPDDEFAGDFGVTIKDERTFKLSHLLKKEKDSLVYEYDFGDGWSHKVILEKILPFDESVKVAKCIKGKMACPPEDCGGVWGYQNLLEIINDPSNPEHDEMLDWVGGEFDPNYFSLEEVNEMLFEHAKS